MKSYFKHINIFLAVLFFVNSFFLFAEPKLSFEERKLRNPYLVRTFIDPATGKEIDEVRVPPSPPPKQLMPAAEPPASRMVNGFMAANTLNNVPAFTWCYGCSATSAAMMMGYYDNTPQFPNMYTGPANGGVCPMNNVTFWGSNSCGGGTCGECPISVTHQGIDGRSTKGHVDDYWVAIESAAQDPYIGHWTAHSDDCLGDFMGTSQSTKGNVDGGTTFFYYPDGSPVIDYTGSEPGQRDGARGVKLYVEYCGYTVEANGNYNQYIYGHDGNTKGFTFNEYKAEIDAGRPVMIHVTGHTMLGTGYDTSGNKVYLHDTWDHSSHQMTWGGTYGTSPPRQHVGVTVIKLTGSVPPGPGNLVIDKLKGKIKWKDTPCTGSDTIKCSVSSPVSDLSYLNGSASIPDFLVIDGGAGPVSNASGAFLKINGKKTKVILKEVTPSGPTVKTIVKLKDNTLNITHKTKKLPDCDKKYDISNTDADWTTKNVDVKLNCSSGGTTVTNSGSKTINYKTVSDKKTKIK